MSKERYEEDCAGCRPAMLDLETRQALPEDSPPMKAILAVWATLSRQDREAWHEFTCQNSREPQILAAVSRIRDQMQAALQALE